MEEMVCEYSLKLTHKNDKVETYLDSNNIGDDLEHETDLKPGRELCFVSILIY